MERRFVRTGFWAVTIAVGLFVCLVAEATTWLLSPSFPNENGKGFAQDFLGELGGESGVTVSKVSDRWKAAQPDENGYVNLLSHYPITDNKVAYALGIFETKSAGVAAWRFGSDDGIKVWVNGELVYSLAARRGARKDSDECLTRLVAGENTALLKIDNGTGGWGFYFRLAETFPQVGGTHACTVFLTVPQYLLYGSQYPIEQWATARVVNNGTESLDGAALRLCLGESTVGEKVIGKLDALSWTECRAPLKAPAAERRVSGQGEARVLVGEQEIASRKSFPVQVREVHPLLTGRVWDEDGVLRFIHAADTHIVAEETVLEGVKTADNLKAAVRGINGIEPPPDFVMVTGDMTLDSTPGLEYFAELMKPLRVPWLVIPGNHDKPGGEEATLKLFAGNGLPLYYSFDHAGYHIVALDGQPPSGSPVNGGFIPEEIEWLKRDLQLAKGKETLVFVHQHPLATQIGEAEPARGLLDWPELVAVLESFPQVKWVFCGHAHADSFLKHHGIRYIMTTATAYQFSPKEIPCFAKEAGVRLMEYRGGKAASRFLRIDGTWRDDPSIEECPEFSVRAQESATSTK